MTGKTIGWHSDDVAEPSQLSLHDDELHAQLMLALRRISTQRRPTIIGLARNLSWGHSPAGLAGRVQAENKEIWHNF